MNSPEPIYDADVQLQMATPSELPSFSDAREDLAGQEFLAPGFLSSLFAAERRAAHELEELKAIEASLVPRTQSRLNTLAYAGISSGTQYVVGGDLYDFFARGDGRLTVTIGDICGKGVTAALLRANLQASMRTLFSVREDDLEDSLVLLNKFFFQSTPSRSFATLFCAEYDDRTGRLKYANCGHPAGILLRRDGNIERLQTTCTVLGLFEEWECSTAEVQLAPGDTLLLFTDGIVEAFNPAGEEFGEDRLIDLLRENSRFSTSGLLETILGSVQHFSNGQQHDDMTLVGLRCGNFATC